MQQHIFQSVTILSAGNMIWNKNKAQRKKRELIHLLGLISTSYKQKTIPKV